MTENPILYNNLAHRTLLRISTKYLWNIFGLLSLIVIQRQYGYETIGLMAFGTAFVSIFLPLGDLGFGAAHSKRLNEKELDSAICNGTFASIKLVLNLFMMVDVHSVVILQNS